MGLLPGFRLTVVSGKGTGHELTVAGAERTPMKIGRHNPDPTRDLESLGRAGDKTLDLLINEDGQVSRLHAIIEATDRGYVLIDCEPPNKTRHNERLLEPREKVLLKHGDTLRLGLETSIRFDLCPAPEPPNTDGAGKRCSPSPTEVWDKFDVLKKLSENPVGRVHLACDRERGERVVLKRYSRNQISGKARNLLLAGAQKGRLWIHANIAEVVDAGERGDCFYVASRWIDGKSLYDLQLGYAEDIDTLLAIHLTREICAALCYVQGLERGFVWGHLNPRNVVVDREGRAVIVNFGLPSAGMLMEGGDPTESPSARYRSPEHRAGRETDPRSDLYSAGVILYELLGHRPASDQLKPFLDAFGLRHDIPLQVADVANKAVAYPSERRFIYAADMEEALTTLLRQLSPRYGDEPAAWIAQRS